jgi:hypothetical protein
MSTFVAPMKVSVASFADIGVGGPAEAANLGTFGTQLRILKVAAQEEGVRAMMYLEAGTPEEAIKLAVRWLGEEIVVVFPK